MPRVCRARPLFSGENGDRQVENDSKKFPRKNYESPDGPMGGGGVGEGERDVVSRSFIRIPTALYGNSIGNISILVGISRPTGYQPRSSPVQSRSFPPRPHSVFRSPLSLSPRDKPRAHRAFFNYPIAIDRGGATSVFAKTTNCEMKEESLFTHKSMNKDIIFVFALRCRRDFIFFFFFV